MGSPQEAFPSLSGSSNRKLNKSSTSTSVSSSQSSSSNAMTANKSLSKSSGFRVRRTAYAYDASTVNMERGPPPPREARDFQTERPERTMNTNPMPSSTSSNRGGLSSKS